MKKFAVTLAIALGVSAAAAQAGTVSLGIGSDTVRASYSDAFATSVAGASSAQYDIGLLAKPRKEDDYYLGHVGLMLKGDVGSQSLNVTAGIGGRLMYLYLDGNNGGGLALGGEIGARMPQYERFGITASSYYAPNILTVGELNRSWDNTVALDYELIRGGTLFVGYRHLHQSIGPFSGTVDKGLFAGFRLKF